MHAYQAMETEELYAIYCRHPYVTTDSRNCPEGSIFFALKGANFDGNAYAVQALREKGCAAAVVDNPEVAVSDSRLILVDDVLTALQRLAAYHRKMWGGTILQITGTNGKTTTKELVSAVLSQGKRVLSTKGNFNNHIGVPLTLLSIRPEEHDIAVVETGANHPGEIANLCQLVQADYGLITCVGRAHLEGFGSFEGVKRTKGELYDDLRQRGGSIFLDGQNADLVQMAQQRGFEPGARVVPYVQGRVERLTPYVQMSWCEPETATWHSVDTHLIGAYNLPNLLAAVTVGLHFGIRPEQIDAALSGYQPTNSRSELREVHGNRLIVDAYNANPSSMAAALSNFAMIDAEHKMVILGDMRELGAESLEEHRSIVRRLEAMQLDRIWLVGEAFGEVATKGMRIFPDVEAVMEALAANPIRDTTILIKGSNGTRLHKLPEAF